MAHVHVPQVDESSVVAGRSVLEVFGKSETRQMVPFVLPSLVARSIDIPDVNILGTSGYQKVAIHGHFQRRDGRRVTVLSREELSIMDVVAVDIAVGAASEHLTVVNGHCHTTDLKEVLYVYNIQYPGQHWPSLPSPHAL